MGNCYKGFYKFDERDGWGTMEWIDGSTYMGQWSKGIQQGLGIMIQSNLKKAGFFEDNVFQKPLSSREELTEFE